METGLTHSSVEKGKSSQSFWHFLSGKVHSVLQYGTNYKHYLGNESRLSVYWRWLPFGLKGDRGDLLTPWYKFLCETSHGFVTELDSRTRIQGDRGQGWGGTRVDLSLSFGLDPVHVEHFLRSGSFANIIRGDSEFFVIYSTPTILSSGPMLRRILQI